MTGSNCGRAVCTLLLCMLLSASVGSAPGAVPASAGLVLAVTGPGVVKSSTDERKLAPMAVVDRGDTIVTGRGGTVTLLFFPDGQEYTLGPKSSARLEEKSVKRLAGSVGAASPAGPATAVPRTPRLNSTRVAGEIVRAESPYVGFLSPSPNGAVLKSAPDYQWALAKPRSASRLMLLDSANRELASREVRGDEATSTELGAPPLEAGHTYTAQLWALDGSGALDPNTLLASRFQLLPADQAEEVRQAMAAAEAARQANPKDLAATFKLLFLLTERRLYREALATGEFLKEQLPDNPFILRFLALSYRESGQKAAANRLLREAERIETSGGR